MKKKLLIPKEKAQTEKIDLPVDIPVVRFVKTETPTISSKTLFCRKCGERLEINVNFCRKCGAQVWKEDNKNDL